MIPSRHFDWMLMKIPDVTKEEEEQNKQGLHPKPFRFWSKRHCIFAFNFVGCPGNLFLLPLIGKESEVTSRILYLYITVKADCRYKDAFHVLEGHWTVLFLVDEKRECVFYQVQ